MQIFCLQLDLSANFSNNPNRYFNTSLKKNFIVKKSKPDKACTNHKIMTLTIQNKKKLKQKSKKISYIKWIIMILIYTIKIITDRGALT